MRGTNIAINSIASRYSSNTPRTGFVVFSALGRSVATTTVCFIRSTCPAFFNGHRAIPSHQEAREAAVMNRFAFSKLRWELVSFFHL